MLFSCKDVGPASNVAEAVRAIEAIVEQGEGPPGDWRNAHFGRSLPVLSEYLEMLNATPGVVVTRSVLLALVRSAETGEQVDLITDPDTARVAGLCNFAYKALLHLLYRLMCRIDESPDQIETLAAESVGIMSRVIASLADILTTMSVGPGHQGRTAGATFEFLCQADYLNPHRWSAWLIGAGLLTSAAAQTRGRYPVRSQLGGR